MAATGELVGQGERLVDRLRSLSEGRLLRSAEGPSIADSGHALAQVLDDLAADLAGRVRRDLPRLHHLATGDQVAVTLHELERSADLAEPASAERACTVAAAAIRALRDQIDP